MLYFICFVYAWTQKNKHFVSFSFINKQKISSVNVSILLSIRTHESFERFGFVSISNQFDIVDLFSKNLYDR